MRDESLRLYELLAWLKTGFVDIINKVLKGGREDAAVFFRLSKSADYLPCLSSSAAKPTGEKSPREVYIVVAWDEALLAPTQYGMRISEFFREYRSFLKERVHKGSNPYVTEYLMTANTGVADHLRMLYSAIEDDRKTRGADTIALVLMPNTTLRNDIKVADNARPRDVFVVCVDRHVRFDESFGENIVSVAPLKLDHFMQWRRYEGKNISYSSRACEAPSRGENRNMYWITCASAVLFVGAHMCARALCYPTVGGEELFRGLYIGNNLTRFVHRKGGWIEEIPMDLDTQDGTIEIGTRLTGGVARTLSFRGRWRRSDGVGSVRCEGICYFEGSWMEEKPWNTIGPDAAFKDPGSLSCFSGRLHEGQGEGVLIMGNADAGTLRVCCGKFTTFSSGNGIRCTAAKRCGAVPPRRCLFDGSFVGGLPFTGAGSFSAGNEIVLTGEWSKGEFRGDARNANMMKGDGMRVDVLAPEYWAMFGFVAYPVSPPEGDRMVLDSLPSLREVTNRASVMDISAICDNDPSLKLAPIVASLPWDSVSQGT